MRDLCLKIFKLTWITLQACMDRCRHMQCKVDGQSIHGWEQNPHQGHKDPERAQGRDTEALMDQIGCMQPLKRIVHCILPFQIFGTCLADKGFLCDCCACVILETPRDASGRARRHA